IIIPEDFGGQGLGFAETAVVAEELARTLSPEPLVASSVLSASLLIAGENDALKKKLLPKLASGEAIV
ncbi:acyl-CoA dehydrogenase family protein, partial [Providencia stuartii]|uniref:acyl-CoA dehydrogenase family protein n=1 Tax=Providencia stuartii TaxID=588 RepID=UPI0013D4CD7E